MNPMLLAELEFSNYITRTPRAYCNDITRIPQGYHEDTVQEFLTDNFENEEHNNVGIT